METIHTRKRCHICPSSRKRCHICPSSSLLKPWAASRLSLDSSSWVLENFQMYKLDLEKAEEPEIKLPTSAGSQKKQGNFRKTSTSASLTTPKPLTVWITRNCGKFLKRWEYQITLTCLQGNLCAGQEAIVRTIGTWNNGSVWNWERSTSRLYI